VAARFPDHVAIVAILDRVTGLGDDAGAAQSIRGAPDPMTATTQPGWVVWRPVARSPGQ